MVRGRAARQSDDPPQDREDAQPTNRHPADARRAAAEPQPTEPQPAPDPAAAPPRPRLLRSSTDSMIGGVAGGLGRHFGVDPLAIRITFVILTFAGGLGVLAYLAGLVFLPQRRPRRRRRCGGASRARVGAGLLAVAASRILVPNWLWGPELSGCCSSPASSSTC